jgi:hypothetical protein
MMLFRRCLREFWKLFVDDAFTAALIVGWIVAACITLRQLPAGLWSGPILFAGLAVIVAIRTGKT